jgi:hypothetical protein
VNEMVSPLIVQPSWSSGLYSQSEEVEGKRIEKINLTSIGVELKTKRRLNKRCGRGVQGLAAHSGL